MTVRRPEVGVDKCLENGLEDMPYEELRKSTTGGGDMLLDAIVQGA
jgi:hypothetical protein